MHYVKDEGVPSYSIIKYVSTTRFAVLLKLEYYISVTHARFFVTDMLTIIGGSYLL